MFSYISGLLAGKNPQSAVIDCGGVGFFVNITAKSFAKLPDEGETCKLFTFMDVRDDAIELYGFCDRDELDCFKMLTGVSGVGNKLALTILSDMSPAALSSAIAAENLAALTSISGIGNKTAQRIMLELREKAAFFTTGADDLPQPAAAAESQDAVRALMVLGYSAAESRDAVKRAGSGGGTVEQIVREALKLLL